MTGIESSLCDIKALVNRALAAEISEDALGLATLVSVCWRYGYRTSQVALMKESLEHWAEEKISLGCNGQRIDRDLTAAAFVLGMRYERLCVETGAKIPDDLTQKCLHTLRSHWVVKTGFFENFAYTCFITDFLIATFPSDQLTSECLEFIISSSKNAEVTFNDPANLAAVLMVQRVAEKPFIAGAILEFSKTQFGSVELFDHKALVVALGLWRNRKQVGSKRIVREGRELAQRTLATTASELLSASGAPAQVVQEYGQPQATISLTLLAALFALAAEITSGTVLISAGEIEESSWFARMAGLIVGGVIILVFVYVGFYGIYRFKSYEYPNGFEEFLHQAASVEKAVGVLVLHFGLVAIATLVVGLGIWFGWGLIEQATCNKLDKWPVIWAEMKKKRREFLTAWLVAVLEAFFAVISGK